MKSISICGTPKAPYKKTNWIGVMPGTAPTELARFLTLNGYHPRSSKHGDAMCEFLLRDLYSNCPAFNLFADDGKIVYQTNHTVNPDSPTRWTIDLVVGPGRREHQLLQQTIARGNPSEIWLAVDAKAIMTEHGKARRNRQRDLNSMAEILHRMRPSPIAGAYVVINMSAHFRSPLRTEESEHRNIGRIVSETIPLFQEILKDEQSGRPGLDAIGISVVDYSNLPGSECKLVESSPAPAPSNPLYYQAFLSRICRDFTTRFASEPHR